MSDSVYISLGPLEASCPLLTMDRGSECEALSPSLILQRFFSGGMLVSPPHLRGPDALVGGLCPGALEGHSKNPQAPQMTPISCQGSVSSSTTRC